MADPTLCDCLPFLSTDEVLEAAKWISLLRRFVRFETWFGVIAAALVVIRVVPFVFRRKLLAFLSFGLATITCVLLFTIASSKNLSIWSVGTLVAECVSWPPYLLMVSWFPGVAVAVIVSVFRGTVWRCFLDVL
jgi:hypothetical protein